MYVRFMYWSGVEWRTVMLGLHKGYIVLYTKLL
jgi:hypothetical protein